MSNDFVRERAHWGRATILAPAAEYPHITQTDRLFCLDFFFSAQGATTSMRVPVNVEFSGFGEIQRLRLAQRDLTPALLESAHASITQAKNSPVQLRRHSDVVDFVFIDDQSQRQKAVTGILISSADGRLASLVIPLRDKR